MQTKHIEKLEELKGYEWECRGLQLKFDGFDVREETLQLHSKNFLSEIGDIIGRFEFIVSKYNLEQLEFYGLKVVLNEKPKLSKKEMEFLSVFEDAQTYIARDKDNVIRLFSDEPSNDSQYWYVRISECEDDECGIAFKSQYFAFITWESGKAWSKAELMELEVMGQ